MTNSILFMSYGQSNADCHDAGPAFDSPFLDDDRVVVPNDTHGFRGTQGSPPRRPMTRFRKAYGFEPNCQSSIIPAAVRFLRHYKGGDCDQVIVRSAAKGGRPLLGYHHNDRNIDGIYKNADGSRSFILSNMLVQASEIIRIAEKTQMPVSQVFIPFFHGEADRVTPYDQYVETLGNMMGEIDDEFRNLGLPTTWLLTQASGTSPGYSGNAWSNREAIKDIADTRSNAALVCANYGYALCDGAHLDARSKVLIGELIGYQAAKIANGEDCPTIRPDTIKVDGKTIDVTLTGRPELEIDTTRFPAPKYHSGFQIAGQNPDFVQGVTIIGLGQFRLTCAAALPERFQLNYAFAARKSSDHQDDTLYPFGRGYLREKWTGASFTLGGEQLLKWVPGFSVLVDDQTQNKSSVSEHLQTIAKSELSD